MNYKNNPQLQLTYDFLQYTNQNIFLTGKAGTGKTTFLRNLKKESPKRSIIVAPTGVAAINAGGVTIHSFFQLSFGPQIPDGQFGMQGAYESSGDSVKSKRFSKLKINIIRSLDLLIIDEISMVRADMLDAIDAVLRRYRDRNKPFGGVQLLMIGDLQQLSPVVKEDEWNILKNYYETCYFFSSRALKKSNFTGIELKHIYRQSDQHFIDLLNKVRDNILDADAIAMLNSRYKKNFTPNDDEGYIILTTHNYQSQKVNASRLTRLSTKMHSFECRIEGEFPESAYPADELLQLKVGAQVMFLKNDSSIEHRYFNGKIGTIISINDDAIEVQCKNETEPIRVERDTWDNTKYTLNEKTSEIEEELLGQFIQFPLKLAWAITIHKSQGLTFDKAIIDAQQSFAHGQVYVALSRCRSFEGLVLSSPLDTESVINDRTVTHFTRDVEQNQPGEKELTQARVAYEKQLVAELFDYKTLSGHLRYFLSVWAENAPYIMGNMRDVMVKTLSPIQTEMIEVAEKFYIQMSGMINQHGGAEGNELLNQRIARAVDYYVQKIKEHIEEPLEQASFRTDNKAIRKRLSDVFDRIEQELEVRKACLVSMKDGFSVQKYLQVRAGAVIEKPAKSARSKVAFVDVQNPEFYKLLVGWRAQKSEETGLDESRIIRHPVMAAISAKLPVSAKSLKAVKGMGGKKMQQFGSDILSLILKYKADRGEAIPSDAKREVEYASLDTKEISLRMFGENRSIADVAKRRGFATSTIEGHLAHFIGTGELDIFDVMDKKKYKKIEELTKTGDNILASEIKDKLGDEFSYGEIKMALAHLSHRK